MIKIFRIFYLIFPAFFYFSIFPSALHADNHPGVKHNSKLKDKLKKALNEKPKSYTPRTRHIDKAGRPKFINRLILETSPYLLQHAHNPVDWYPWGDEAFNEAKRLGRPIFMSIGYSTCHWCHVMEEESFEDEEIAKFLNENYIAIKVDREERPDVDAIYMSAVQTLTGGGGWPMSMWLLPNRKPFYGGTYFPPRDGARGARVGFLSILKQISELYKKDKKRINTNADQLTAAVRTSLTAKSAPSPLSPGILKTAVSYYESNFDSRLGGLNRAPKFPSSLPNRFLLRYYHQKKDKKSLAMAELTLKKMAAGGMYDHVGGGFHRYSTDKDWLVPHFEKMLYDNGLLAVAYLEAYQVTKDDFYKGIVEEILEYIKKDMTSPEGVFYSATDADSPVPEKPDHREEGLFFTWTPKEFKQHLSAKEMVNQLIAYYGITEKGNFEGRSIMHTRVSLKDFVKKNKLKEKDFRQAVKAAKEKLYEVRQKRFKPLRDDKILVSWNSLVISAYAKAGIILNNKEYVNIAAKAATLIIDKALVKGRLFRTYKDGKAKINGYLDDYAFFIAALLDLYEATGDLQWYRQASELDRTLEKYFEDKKDGGFFMTSSDHEKLLVREKPLYDGAEPSGNSIQAMNLVRFYEFTTDENYFKRAKKVFEVAAETLKRHPAALSEMLLALHFYLDNPKEIVIVTPKTKAQAEPLLKVYREAYVPNSILVVLSESEIAEAGKSIPLVKSKRAIKGKSTAYVCIKSICKFPTSEPKKFAELIN